MPVDILFLELVCLCERHLTGCDEMSDNVREQRRLFVGMRKLWAMLVRGLWLGMLALVLPVLALAMETGVGAPASSTLVLDVYVRADCPHCTAAKQFLPQLQQRFPDLPIRLHAVDSDPVAREALLLHAQRANIWPPGVPLFVIGDAVSLGFDSAAETGPTLMALIEGELAGQTPRGQTAEVDSLWGRLKPDELGLPLFTLALGLLDGFNPCAMWVLLFLLSLLVHLHDRRRMALIAGCFVLVSGVVYYLFMAAWLNVFLLIGWSSRLQIVLAVLAMLMGVLNLKDFFQPGVGPSLHIPAAAKPGLYARMRAILAEQQTASALLGVALLAVIVNIIELLCTAGLPALYTSVLAQQGLSPTAHYGYLALYIAGYIADDSVMVATAVWALNRAKLSERGGRWLKLLSAAVMFSLGIVMLWHPEWLR